jgi:hypothetical protein
LLDALIGQWSGAVETGGLLMGVVKDVCTIVPTVLATAATVLAVGVVIGLSSWSLL